MAVLFAVPEVAAGATEVVVSEWLVAPGEAFKAGDAIAVIETDKAIVEVEADSDAVLLRALVEAGRAVAVGSPMALFGSDDEAGRDVEALLVDLGVTGSTTSHEAAPRRDVPADDTARVFISPIARRLMRDAGLSLDGVRGTGPRGRIRRRDVDSVIAAAAAGDGPAVAEAPPTLDVAIAPLAAPRPVPHAGAGWTEEPHSRLRLAVARRLSESKQQVPHFYVRRTAVLDDLLALRSQVNAASPVRISVNDFVIRAIAVAHTRVPEANVIWTDDAMRRFDSVDISVAIASERGLVTPVLRSVETSSLSAISAQVRDFVAQADEGTLPQSALEGGSISISNLGMLGVEEFAAIINPPQSAILAVGAARQVPTVVAGKVRIRTAVELVLSVDHRAIDGALAAQWMGALVDALHQPLLLLV